MPVRKLPKTPLSTEEAISLKVQQKLLAHATTPLSKQSVCSWVQKPCVFHRAAWLALRSALSSDRGFEEQRYPLHC